ncbi:MAG TPA: 3-hydroxyacyl-CoA dehydrogenase family protein [Thermoplasmata archaeon]|nr:3-hydroxyacyl-CoA dehydrogenase family protein [Thermoplasmata archaeon]
MTAPAPERLFVVGAGIMGSGIAAQAALGGLPVVLEDVSEALAQKGLDNARRAIDHAVGRGKVAADARDGAVTRLTSAVGLDRVREASFVIEAAPEDLGIKRRLFADLEGRVAPETILASNTSSLPITAIGQELRDPGRLVGLHFFNPVLQMPLVELIPGHRTRPEVVARAERLATSLGKTVVRSADTPGFVTTRALAVLVNEAAWMLYEGVATRDDIDTAYKLGFHHPMGPFELVDLVGIDTAVSILDVLWDGFRDARYRACPLLRTMVAAKKLGRKTGEGFYTYPASGPGR